MVFENNIEKKQTQNNKQMMNEDKRVYFLLEDLSSMKIVEEDITLFFCPLSLNCNSV
jgi:hypothetical protein